MRFNHSVVFGLTDESTSVVCAQHNLHGTPLSSCSQPPPPVSPLHVGHTSYKPSALLYVQTPRTGSVSAAGSLGFIRETCDGWHQVCVCVGGEGEWGGRGERGVLERPLYSRTHARLLHPRVYMLGVM
jgi:hypothetical protein